MELCAVADLGKLRMHCLVQPWNYVKVRVFLKERK